MMSGDMSIWKVPEDDHTYVVDLPTPMSDELIKTLIGSYRAIQKESEVADLLYKSIQRFLLNGNRDLLLDAMRQFEEHRGIDNSED